MKRMFGGAGLCHQDALFGLVADDALYFKARENRADEKAAGPGTIQTLRDLCDEPLRDTG